MASGCAVDVTPAPTCLPLASVAARGQPLTPRPQHKRALPDRLRWKHLARRLLRLSPVLEALQGRCYSPAPAGRQITLKREGPSGVLLQDHWRYAVAC